MRLETMVGKMFPDMKVGGKLFAIITPSTPHLYLRQYRPRPYFVLEVLVTEVEESAEGIELTFDTNFLMPTLNLFANVDDAKERLVGIFQEETDGMLPIEKVRLVSSQEYQEASVLHEKELPKVKVA